ncbi:hypothetical protein LCGC14_0779870 [marine sediment metagenome]|uniref:Uncharacterized protein n=1 Tax=marine sediment metagenome TaxID=412755 RepID=A0A0F9Q034_9ZZZZ
MSEIVMGLIIGLIGIIVGLIGVIATIIAVHILLKDRRNARAERKQSSEIHDETFEIYREVMLEKGCEVFKTDTPINELPDDLKLIANRYWELLSGWGIFNLIWILMKRYFQNNIMRENLILKILFLRKYLLPLNC